MNQQEPLKLDSITKETYRANPYQPSKSLFIAARVCAELLDKEHSSTVFFYTIGQSDTKGKSIEEEWQGFNKVLADVTTNIHTNNLIAAIVVGVEMYSKNKGRPNSKALRPHVHMTVFAYNDFLCVPKAYIENEFLKLGFDFKIDQPKKHFDIAKSLTYTVKSGKQEVLRKVTNHFLGSEPVTVLINPVIKENPVKNFVKALRSRAIPINVLEIQNDLAVESVSRFNGDTKMQMANFLRKQCLTSQTGIYKGFIMQKVRPSHFTWIKKTQLANFIQYIITPDLPDTYKQAIYNSAKWILEEGAVDSGKSIVQAIFPRLKMQANLWEFQDKQVYDFQTGEVVRVDQLEPFTSCSKFILGKWDAIKKPHQVLNIVQRLVPKEKQRIEFVTALGGLFHNLGNRKVQKAIWISGPSNSFKTWFVANFLDACFNEVLITRINQSKTQFKYGRIRGVTEGILYIDEFKSEDFKQTAQFLHITDGQDTVLEEKYLVSEETAFKGHPIITSNEAIKDTEFKQTMKKALKVRYQEAHFQPAQEDVQHLIHETKQTLDEEEWEAFAVMANWMYLKENFSKQADLPKSWRHETEQPQRENQSAVQAMLSEWAQTAEEAESKEDLAQSKPPATKLDTVFAQKKPTLNEQAKNEKPKRKRGRPRLTPEQKAANVAERRKNKKMSP